MKGFIENPYLFHNGNKICIKYIDMYKVTGHKEPFLFERLIAVSSSDNSFDLTNQIKSISKLFSTPAENIQFYSKSPKLFSSEDFDWYGISESNLGCFCYDCGSQIKVHMWFD